MNEVNLEQEIEEASERIQTRQSEIQSELDKLEVKIPTYTDWAWGFVLTGVVLSVFSVIYYVCKNQESGFGLNLLGDFLGGSVASVWALAGLFLIYVAFLGQKQQLLHQQLEIMYSQLEVKFTRLELAGQKAEMAEQNKTLRRQKFENTFFQLLRNYQDIVNGIDLRKVNNGNWTTIAEGRDCFKNFYDKVFSNRIPRNTEDIHHTIKRYDEFYQKNQSDLGHYFRHIYHILKFIKNSKELKDSEKFTYTNLLRALLSSYELIFIFYNGLGKHGSEKLKPLLEEFSILKNMDFELLINSEHRGEYSELAYASSEDRKRLLNNSKLITSK